MELRLGSWRSCIGQGEDGDEVFGLSARDNTLVPFAREGNARDSKTYSASLCRN